MNIKKFNKPKFFKNILYNDTRGTLVEIYLKKKFNLFFKNCILVSSKKNTIRGLHFQKKKPQIKIIFLIKGFINDFVVDIRKNKRSFGKIYNFKLKQGNALIIPKGFAHGYSCLHKENIVLYLMSEYWYPEYESGIKWNDKILNLKWKIKKPIVSKKDKLLGQFFEI